MKYDFETLVDRWDAGSAKWESMKDWKPDVSRGVVPFSVADMEFRNPPEILDGLKKFLDEAVLGYAVPTAGYLDAVRDWMRTRHDWEIKREWILGAEGVVGAFYNAIRALSSPGDGVIVQTPVYYPFYRAIEGNGRVIVRNPLALRDGRYEIDFKDLEAKARDPRNKVLLFCSPHNPTGRVWTREELSEVGDICLRNGLRIISDEIHFDLVMPGFRHTVFANLSPRLAENMIVCTAPSKTFNLAGLHVSNIVIPDEGIRKAYASVAESNGFFSLGILGYKACEIAYRECGPWLDELIEVIHRNHRKLKEFIGKRIPAVRVFDLEGTYLQWMDFRKLGLDQDELEGLTRRKAEVFFDEGYVFGEEGSGFERMNLACPTGVLTAGLERLAAAVDGLGR